MTVDHSEDRFGKRLTWVPFAALGILAITGLIEWFMGRLPLGPDGRFGLWEPNIWSSEQSQRLLDPYSFSHFIHGMLLYAVLTRVFSTAPLRCRFVTALLFEAGWELLENSPIIINRYRSVTIALGYEGDSILNSMSDILMVALGFWFTYKQRPWVSMAAIVLMEVGTLLWVRDNLTLNVIMLVHPVEVIRHWQLAAQPPP